MSLAEAIHDTVHSAEFAAHSREALMAVGLGLVLSLVFFVGPIWFLVRSDKRRHRRP